MRKILVAVMAMVTMFWFATPTHAVLWDRGGGLIYDVDRDITWLQNAGMGGLRIWSDPIGRTGAIEWAADLVYGGYEDWRLPTALNQDGSGPDWGWDEAGSEMGHLYYTELGNPPHGPLTNAGPFINLNLDPGEYWSGTQEDTLKAWYFLISEGQASNYLKEREYNAWAVRDGDVGAPVPEPTTMLLLGSGLIGLAGYGRKKFFKK